ncbi:helix-turn-helix domain-containing protein [Neomoorella humiferrea]|uniref:helix-turn-helix domain-containing protein n=1 Tax=Neomoorella humiferrea TaxID=676965 RepID=UPI003D8FF58D
MKTLGERLTALRRERNLTQAELARSLNMAQSTIAMYEKNKRTPDAATLQKLADFFRVSVDYLLGRDESSLPAVYEIQNEKLSKKLPFLKETNSNPHEDPLFQYLFQRLSDLTPQQRKRLARSWYKALKKIEKEKPGDHLNVTPGFEPEGK